MCFSATASFTASAVLCFMGIGCLALIPAKAKASMTRVQRMALGVVAAAPLLFGLHQYSEGLVWQDPSNRRAIKLFAYTAYTFWPLHASVGLALVECTTWRQHSQRQRPIRKRWLIGNVILAVFLSALVTRCLNIVRGGVRVHLAQGHLKYRTCQAFYPHWLTTLGRLVYGYIIVGSLYASSLPFSNVLASAALISFVITLKLWENEFESTWCFFAACLSVLGLRTIQLELESYPDNQNNTDDSCDDIDGDLQLAEGKLQKRTSTIDTDDDDHHDGPGRGEEEEEDGDDCGPNGAIGLVPLV